MTDITDDEADFPEPESADSGYPEPEAGTFAPDPYSMMHEADPESAEALMAEWGEEFDRNIDLARVAVDAFADTGVVEVLEQAGIGSDPRVVRVAAEIGRLLNRGAPDQPAPDGADREALEQELDELVGSGGYWSDRVQRRVRQIYLSLYGGGETPVHRAAGDAGGRR